MTRDAGASRPKLRWTGDGPGRTGVIGLAKRMQAEVSRGLGQFLHIGVRHDAPLGSLGGKHGRLPARDGQSGLRVGFGLEASDLEADISPFTSEDLYAQEGPGAPTFLSLLSRPQRATKLVLPSGWQLRSVAAPSGWWASCCAKTPPIVALAQRLEFADPSTAPDAHRLVLRRQGGQDAPQD